MKILTDNFIMLFSGRGVLAVMDLKTLKVGEWQTLTNTGWAHNYVIMNK
jgi:hypothetical protein